MNTLLISGSPRKGNTEYILKTIFDSIKEDKDIILLRELDLKHCDGCLTCDESNKCHIKDDMQNLYEKLIQADIIVLGTPNYFNNVSGLLKDFIDRTNPFYQTDKLKGKKLINVVVGDMGEEECEKVVSNVLNSFKGAHQLELLGSYCFKGLATDDIKNNKELEEQKGSSDQKKGIKEKIKEITEKITSFS